MSTCRRSKDFSLINKEKWDVFNFEYMTTEYMKKSPYLRHPIWYLGTAKNTHCPYVKSIADRLAFVSRELIKIEVNTIAIMSNDVENYPEDSFENMKKVAAKFNFSFPYLLDESQEIAKSYGAVCTPDFFGYYQNLKLQYR